MSEWCTLHAKVANNEKLPNEEKITNDIKTQCNHSRTKIHNNELYILIMENNVEPLKEFVKKHQEAFNTVGIAKSNNYGVGSQSNNRVTFYDVQNGRLNKIKTCECPSKYNGLQVISTR